MIWILVVLVQIVLVSAELHLLIIGWTLFGISLLPTSAFPFISGPRS